MATSQNGWPAYARGNHPDLVVIPHVAGRVRGGDVATILTHLVLAFDRHVEPLAEAAGQPEDDWGWASRPIIGNPNDLSNHASGTALDLNAPRHPLGKRGTFTAGQVARLRSVLAVYEGVVRWGGDYSGRADEMHFEINAKPARVAQIAAKLRNQKEDDMPTAKEIAAEVWNTPVTRVVNGKNVKVSALQELADAKSQTAGIAREREYSLRQEVADAKTNTISLLAMLTAQGALLKQLAQGAGVVVDYDRIAAEVREVVRTEVVKVDVSIGG